MRYGLRMLAALVVVVLCAGIARAQSDSPAAAVLAGLKARDAARWQDAPGAIKSELGAVAGTFQIEELAVVLYHRTVHYPAKAAATLRPQLPARIEEFFPPSQREGCAKLFYWKGDVFHSVVGLPVRLQDGKWVATDGSFSDFPIPTFRKRMMRQWSCNPLRWNVEDKYKKNIQREYPGEEGRSLDDPLEDKQK